MFSGIPAQDAEVIAAARAEILAVERLKDSLQATRTGGTHGVTAKMKSGGTQVPSTSSTTTISLPAGRTVTATAAASTACPSTQYLRGGHQTRCKAHPDDSQLPIWEDQVSFALVGVGDEDHIITRVIPGTDPLQEFDEDDPADVITIDHETNESDVDDLSEVSMTSADTMTKEETSRPFGQHGRNTTEIC